MHITQESNKQCSWKRDNMNLLVPPRWRGIVRVARLRGRRRPWLVSDKVSLARITFGFITIFTIIITTMFLKSITFKYSAFLWWSPVQVRSACWSSSDGRVTAVKHWSAPVIFSWLRPLDQWAPIAGFAPVCASVKSFQGFFFQFTGNSRVMQAEHFPGAGCVQRKSQCAFWRCCHIFAGYCFVYPCESRK